MNKWSFHLKNKSFYDHRSLLKHYQQFQEFENMIPLYAFKIPKIRIRNKLITRENIRHAYCLVLNHPIFRLTKLQPIGRCYMATGEHQVKLTEYITRPTLRRYKITAMYYADSIPRDEVLLPFTTDTLFGYTSPKTVLCGFCAIRNPSCDIWRTHLLHCVLNFLFESLFCLHSAVCVTGNIVCLGGIQWWLILYYYYEYFPNCAPWRNRWWL